MPDVALPEIPATPGVYTWWRGGEPVYVGGAANLRRRLGERLKTGLDLSGSTLRGSIALAELGIPRRVSSARPTQVSQAEADTINAWLRACELAWVRCDNGRRRALARGCAWAASGSHRSQGADATTAGTVAPPATAQGVAGAGATTTVRGPRVRGFRRVGDLLLRRTREQRHRRLLLAGASLTSAQRSRRMASSSDNCT